MLLFRIIFRGFRQLLCSTVSDVLLSYRGHLCLIKSPATVSPAATLAASCELLSVSSYLHVGDEALFDSPGGGGDFIQKLQLIIVTATHDSTNDRKRLISLFNAAFHWLSNVRLEEEDSSSASSSSSSTLDSLHAHYCHLLFSVPQLFSMRYYPQ